MTKLRFGTKAETIQALHGRLATAKVPRSSIWSTAEWRKDSDVIVKSIREEFTAGPVIVRSSARCEDGSRSSLAGKFRSISDVSPDNASQLSTAIDEVIASYGAANSSDQFFVQPQVTDLAACGVLFTRDIDTFAPYLVINYDQAPGVNDGVTSGKKGELKTFVCFKHAEHPTEDPMLRQLIAAANELEQIFDCDHLDIEFGWSGSSELFILQVRPLTTGSSATVPDSKTFADYLLKIWKKAKKLSSPHPGLCGAKGMYSVMTDWNPAEMIGLRPRMLALSLYKTLITDSIWAYQRHNYGYRDLRSFPLLVSYMGLPYIDVRVSFNSFVPRTLDDGLAHRLVDYYMTELAAAPTFHDKVEFNIVFSCYDFDILGRTKKLLDHGFTELEIDRIKFALLDLTSKVICPANGIYKTDEQRIQTLEQRFVEIEGSDLPLLDRIYWLTQDCMRYGTLPFAGLARAGFIAMQMLRSMVRTEILTVEQMESFMASLDTVTKHLSRDSAEFRRDGTKRRQFVERYGHLRPRTYDILSPTYADELDRLFPSDSLPADEEPVPAFALSAEQMSRLEHKLRENGLKLSGAEFIDFLRRAIEGREYSKFVFTRNLSRVLTLIGEFGEYVGISKEDLSHLDIQLLLSMYSVLEPDDACRTLRANIERNREAHEVTKLIRLPQLIQSENDVYGFHMSEVEPNFVTQASVTDIIVLEEDLVRVDPSSRIVFIKSADPGYDWLFSRGISGLVTLYGGANSHMAIRCAELGIPAVIGCGEQNFAAWSRAKTLSIDCLNCQVKALS